MFCFFFFNDTATTEIYTYDTLFPYTTLVRSIRAAIAAGIDTIEHVSLVDDEGIRMALARGRPVWFSMDIYNTEYTQAEGAKNGVLEDNLRKDREIRSEEHTSELQSLMRISYAVFCLKKKKTQTQREKD